MAKNIFGLLGQGYFWPARFGAWQEPFTLRLWRKELPAIFRVKEALYQLRSLPSLFSSTHGKKRYWGFLVKGIFGLRALALGKSLLLCALGWNIGILYALTLRMRLVPFNYFPSENGGSDGTRTRDPRRDKPIL
jgi:hypothetical protein